MRVASRITVSTTRPSAAQLTWVFQSCGTPRTIGLPDTRQASGDSRADPACTDAATATADAGLTVGARASESEVVRLGKAERLAAAGEIFTPPELRQPIALSRPSGSWVRGVAMEVF
ncbi:hypothetical protein MASR1M6_12200 [Rubrivivax sp.]